MVFAVLIRAELASMVAVLKVNGRMQKQSINIGAGLSDRRVTPHLGPAPSYRLVSLLLPPIRLASLRTCSEPSRQSPYLDYP